MENHDWKSQKIIENEIEKRVNTFTESFFKTPARLYHTEIRFVMNFVKLTSDMFPNGKTKGGHDNGIDEILAYTYVGLRKRVMKSPLDTKNLREALRQNLKEHQQWVFHMQSSCPQTKEEWNKYLDAAYMQLQVAEHAAQVGYSMDLSQNIFGQEILIQVQISYHGTVTGWGSKSEVILQCSAVAIDSS